MGNISNSVLEQIKPDVNLNKKIQSTIGSIVENIEMVRTELEIEFTVELVGSTAKGTHLKGGDIDLFVGFDPSVPEKELREIIFTIGRRTIPDHIVRYADHPYVRGTVNGFEVDLVPCYRVDSGDRIISAVDRTPFHTRYVISKLSESQKDEVRLLKQFLKGIGSYGAENKTMGFSGYLSELLIIRYGTFIDTLRGVAGWSGKTFIDLEEKGHNGKESFGEEKSGSLIIIDPVDPARNVASPVSLEKIGLFIRASRDFLTAPGLKFFFPSPKSLLNKEETDRALQSHGKILFLSFPCPDVVDDILHPQLRMTLQRLRAMLTDCGFILNDSGYVVRESIYLFFEFLVSSLPETTLHRGPKVYNKNHEERFLEKWEERNPFLIHDRWHVFAPVKYRDPEELIEKELPNFQTGRYIMEALKSGFGIHDPSEVPPEVISYVLDKRLPWKR